MTPVMGRPRCSVFIAASLDGFIARRDGGIDWLSIVETPGEDYGYARFFAAVDALVLGPREPTTRCSASRRGRTATSAASS